jgi:hypothetical protein
MIGQRRIRRGNVARLRPARARFLFSLAKFSRLFAVAYKTLYWMEAKMTFNRRAFMLRTRKHIGFLLVLVMTLSFASEALACKGCGCQW